MVPGVSYILSDVFLLNPLERYFSRQKYRGRSNDNPTTRVPFNASTRIQQYHVLNETYLESVCQSYDKETTSVAKNEWTQQTIMMIMM